MADLSKLLVACAGCAGAALVYKVANKLNDANQDPKSTTEDTSHGSHEQDGVSSCPFGFSSEKNNPHTPDFKNNPHTPDFKTKLEEKKKEITTLYEEYIHLDMLREVWHHPTTKNPQLEPVFIATMHSLEISFLLLAEFLTDHRSYVAKRQRIESVAKGIAEQCMLVADLVNADLLMREIEAQPEITENCSASSNAHASKSLSLAQAYPFPDCPPTVRGLKGGAQSPGLARLHGAVVDAFPSLRPSDRLALQNVIRNVTAGFEGAFSRWQVGLGIEEQLKEVRESVGLEPLGGLRRPSQGLYLDYATMVRPDVVLATRTEEKYMHSEDFFFRSIHLATECWSFVALDRLRNADVQCQGERWHEAAAYVRHAGLIIEYLGTNVSVLKSMNLRDYLHLKVEIEGTSGEGSSQVKELKQASQRLLAPLLRAVRATTPGAALAASSEPPQPQPASEPRPRADAGDVEGMALALVRVYRQPEEHEGLHAFAKALEFLDSSVCGGFYFRHFSLAVSVIGSDSKGTMNRSVKALKHAYEASLFPSLDRARTLCGIAIESELGNTKKGRIMLDLSERRRLKQMAAAADPPKRTSAASGGGSAGLKAHGSAAKSKRASAVPAEEAVAEKQDAQRHAQVRAEGSSSSSSSLSSSVAVGLATIAGQPELCAARQGSAAAMEAGEGGQRVRGDDARDGRVRLEPVADLADCDTTGMDAVEKARAELYDESKLPGFFASPEPSRLSFLSHSFGRIPPMVHAASLKSLYQLYARPDSIWETAFSSIIPEAQRNIMALLTNPLSSASAPADTPPPPPAGPSSIPPSHRVEFGHNTHELVLRLMSDAVARDGVLHVLCSDAEFYSFNRQLKRLLDFFKSKASLTSGSPVVTAEVVPVCPAASFQQRLLQKAKELRGKINFVYVSHVTYKTQETLIQDLAVFGSAMQEALRGSKSEEEEQQTGGTGSCGNDLPYILVDGCHSFGALQVDISDAPAALFFVSTMVKHAASGANAAFICMHTSRASRLQPLSTGWLAHPATLAPLSHGVSLEPGGGAVEFEEGCTMAGATPGWLPSLIAFNELMRAWGALGITLAQAHAHVMALQGRLRSKVDDATRAALLAPTSLSAGAPLPVSPPSQAASASCNTISASASAAASASAPREPACTASASEQHGLGGSRWASHSLSWKACDTPRAVWVVEQLRHAGVHVDSRGPYVRMGFGFNNSTSDVDRLAAACKRVAAGAV